MTDHVGRKLSGCLLIDVIHGDLIELMDPAGRILPTAHLKSGGGLYILPVEIKMSQHAPAVSGGQKAVSDKARQFLMDLVLIQKAEGQVDKDDGISLMLHRTGAGNDLFHITADGAQRKVLGVQNTHIDQDAQVVMGGKPAGGYQLLTDLHIVRAGSGKECQKDLVECIRAVTALDYICGKRVGDHLCQIFQKESEGVVKRYFSFGDHQAEHRFAGSGDIDTELRCSHLIARIIEIAGSVKGFFIIDILFERIDDRLCCLGGSKDGIFQLSVGELFGGNDRKVLACYHHGIGDDRVCQIQKFLDGTVGKTGIHKTLVPAVIAAVEFLQKGQKFSHRYGFWKKAVAGFAGFGQMDTPSGEQNHILGQASDRQRKTGIINQVDDSVVRQKCSFIFYGIF